MKKLMLLAALCGLFFSVHAATAGPFEKIHVAPISASDRARAHFSENYSEVQDVNWYTATDNRIYCIFHQGRKTNRVFYDNQGYWQCTIVSYPPSGLNKKINDMVSGHFPGYDISYVNEVRSEYEEPVYMINIQDAANIKVIKVVGEEFEVKQSLSKQ